MATTKTPFFNGVSFSCDTQALTLTRRAYTGEDQTLPVTQEQASNLASMPDNCAAHSVAWFHAVNADFDRNPGKYLES
ncbi:hypothetical protein [Ramlibacter alkalitolerans]|uniref:Uncharacterized protein n=1 Tax=Ramlibacter alkalitolerans TaxID=2039631 RepID=A0ABS1JU11_9BURK|nr:hypothetical protein [Ramlibacter alkalitolerans]MBL0427708.1 hypothetical protein [Ramlibacter alkalitolerans]